MAKTRAIAPGRRDGDGTVTARLATSIRVALWRARTCVAAVALAYLVSVLVGVAMVHSGNTFALAHRDAIVSRAWTGNVLTQDSPLQQATADFAGNALAAGSDTLLGLGVVLPFPAVLYRGWVGGIVSVDGDHASRLSEPGPATYYISTLMLQLLGYSLAAGAGLNVGVSLWRARPAYSRRNRLGVPIEAVRDLFRLYLLVIPVLLVASLWEFLSPWR
jgi:hypothetical protein